MADDATVIQLQLAKINLNQMIADTTLVMAHLKDTFEGDMTSDSEWDIREVVGRVDSISILLETLPQRVDDVIDRELNR
jgi:hypothetical protein